MRLSELLDVPVTDSTGATIGGVADVVLVQDGPMLGPHAASYRVAGLIVVEHRHARMLGYERELRPAAFRVLVRKLAGDVLQVRWEDIDQISAESVRLRVTRSDLTDHERSARL